MASSPSLNDATLSPSTVEEGGARVLPLVDCGLVDVFDFSGGGDLDDTGVGDEDFTGFSESSLVSAGVCFFFFGK